MRYTTLFFDLDDTIYPFTCGLWDAIRNRMSRYMIERLGLPEDEVGQLRHHYYVTYGTTLRGLQQHYQVDADDYLAYVHDLPLEAFLVPAPELHSLLVSLPQQRWIFTNADAEHARRVLTRIGLADCFAGIIDIKALNFACKPEPEAFGIAMNNAGETDPHRCLILDDSPLNLAGARQVGMATALVGRNGPDPAFDYYLPDLLALHDRMPELWEPALSLKNPVKAGGNDGF